MLTRTKITSPQANASHVNCYRSVSTLSASILGMALGVSGIQPCFAQMEEILVTAQKRVESLQDTPISMAAYSGTDLEGRGAVNISHVGDFTANVQFDSSVGLSGNPNTSSIYIRGIGQSDFIGTSDPGVGVYLDGVYIARSTGGVLDLLDVERVEVLRGPQGTLFGKNTIGGAISVISKKPDDEFEAAGELTVGNHSRIDAKASVNLPIVEDRLFARIGLATRNSDGTGDLPLIGKHFGGEDSVSGRGVLRFLPSDSLEFSLALDGTKSKDESPIASLLAVEAGPTTLSGLYNLTAGAETGNFYDESYILPEHDVSLATGPTGTDMDLWGAALTADWNAGPVWLKSITSYRTFDADFGRDNDHSPITIIQQKYTYDHEQFSQEFNLGATSFSDRLKWVLGAYYFSENGSENNAVDVVPDTFPYTGLPTSIDGPSEFDNESWAVFGQATLDLTERLSITAGLRYTEEDKELEYSSYYVQLPGTVYVLANRFAKDNFDSLTPRVSLDYELADGFMIYASYGEGFKSGGFVGRYLLPAPEPISFDPEEAKTYEAGFKSEFLDSRIRLNFAGFYTDYTDIQVVVFQGVVPLTRNAAEGEIKGFELEITALPTNDLRLSAGLGYLDAEYTKIDPGDFAGLLVPVTLDSKFVNTPDWSFNVAGEYTFPLTTLGDLSLVADYSYRTKIAKDAANTPELIQDAYGLLNARAVFSLADSNWQFILFGRNLTDEEYLITGASDIETIGIVDGTYGRPREWGVTVKVRL